MSYLTSTTQHESASPIKTQYQPLFPLEYDGIYGPYKPITEIDESISADFINLLLTSPGEWPMNPELGVGLKRYLFEQHNSPELAKLKERIQRQLDMHLANVELIDVRYEPNPNQIDQNLAKVTIIYSVKRGSLISIDALLDAMGSLSITRGLGHTTFSQNAALLRNDVGRRLISDVLRR